MTKYSERWYQRKSATHLLGALGILGLDVFGLYLSQILDNIYLTALVALNFPIAAIYAVVYFFILLFDMTTARHTGGKVRTTTGGDSISGGIDMENDNIVPKTGHFTVFGFFTFAIGMFLSAMVSPYFEALLFDEPVYDIEAMIGIFFISSILVGIGVQVLLVGLGRTYYQA
jgi:hypothetical protein